MEIILRGCQLKQLPLEIIPRGGHLNQPDVETTFKVVGLRDRVFENH